MTPYNLCLNSKDDHTTTIDQVKGVDYLKKAAGGIIYV